MVLTRRDALALGSGALVFAATGLPVIAATDDPVAAFTGGADLVEGGIELDTPEIAENGNTVPVGVAAPGAVSIALFALGNPVPPVATFNFGPLAAAREAATRIRLAGTQEVVAVAKMEDGTFHRVANTVKVTIGGCGG